MSSRKLDIDWGDEEITPVKKTAPKGKQKLDIDWGDEETSPQTGWAGVGNDLLSKIKAIPGIVRAIPGEAQGAAEQFTTPRFGQNLLAGAGEAAEGALNLPHDVLKNLGKNKVIPEWLAKYNELPFTHIPENIGLEEKMGLEGEEKGDALLRSIPGLVGSIKTARQLPGLRPSNFHNKALERALNTIEKTKQEHAELLGQGHEHGARAAQIFLDEIEGKFNSETGKQEGGLRKAVGSKYEQLTKGLQKENIEIPRTPDMKFIQKEVAKLSRGVSGKERENLVKILSEATGKQKVNGADALTVYRELKHQKGQSYKQAYAIGENVSPKARAEWIKQGDHLDELEKKMKGIIEQQVGAKHFEKLKAIDKEYATKIAPLYKNPLYQEILKHGQSSKNIMKVLHGKTAGNETLNAIVKKNPELQKIIVGQQYAEKPSKLSLPSEALEKYEKLNPEISRIIDEQKRIQHMQKINVPNLKEAVTKANKRKANRNAALIGSAGTLGTIAIASAIEKALGGDSKQIPSLAADLKILKRHHKK